MKVCCFDCGFEFELEKIYHDELGTFAVCPECRGSFDVDITKDDLLEDSQTEQKQM